MKALTVSLVDVGERLPLSLKKLAKILNRRQSTYRFVEGEKITANMLGKPDVLYKWFEIPRLCSLVKEKCSDHSDFLIGITNSRLTHSEELKKTPDPDLDYFSRGDLNRCAIMSVHKTMLRYSSPGKNIYQYAAFLVICETLILTAKADLNHDERPTCVFYECGDRELFQGCIEMAEICPNCHATLNRANVSDAVLEDAKRVMKWCSRDTWHYRCRRTIEDPTVTLVLGAGIGWFSSIFVTKQFYPVVAAFVLLPISVKLFRKPRFSNLI